MTPDAAIALMVGMMLGAWLGVALATTDMWWPIWYKQRLSSANDKLSHRSQ